MQKKKLTVDEQIEHLKSKGIRFELITESEAKHFLKEHNFFFKCYAYRKNYFKHIAGPQKDKYIDLDFAYLVDLSRIDMKLRYFLLEACLDIEHAMKIELINDITENPYEDGYKITRDFIKKYNFNLTEIKPNYCNDLLKKYSKKEIPIWSFCEIISFGELIKLYQLYERNYPKRLNLKSTFLFSVRNIRNAVAHNNCLINDLNNTSKNPTNELSNVIATVGDIKNDLRRKKLKHYFLHDFAALIYSYHSLVKSDSAKTKRRRQFKNLFYMKINKNCSYCNGKDQIANEIMVSSAKFCYYIVKKFFQI